MKGFIEVTVGNELMCININSIIRFEVYKITTPHSTLITTNQNQYSKRDNDYVVKWSCKETYEQVKQLIIKAQ